MLPYYSFTFVLLLAYAIFFYRAGESEGSSGILWAGVSVLISVVVWRRLGWGWLGVLLGQVGLFAGITIVRSSRKS
jgi:hypothetical protein